MAIVLDTPAQIDMYRLLVVIRAIETHIRTGGKMRLTRTATPSNLRTIASEYTGKTYPRSLNGLQDALSDLKVIRDNAMTS